ncbi:ABC transporter ATP-binding protein [Paenibacillus albus]|uniref:ABC transporter ATP-binding protein n=1 Tax=Paenibacillus albus TaxID=2495582 RepID=A0A3Q8X574_9BACL|nr:ABC transporter ATP-binding protein [Paenibacillus albus]AZN40791.1 ABC transporter ATP-binding protein [Paenibacillus albus]
MIRVDHLNFQYPNSRREIFKNLSFHVKKGETLAILGANGIGKTTFLKCLLGFLEYKSGNIFINDESVKQMSASKFWKQVAYVPQSKRAAFGFTGLEMTVMGLSPHVRIGKLPTKDDYERAYEQLTKLGIEHLSERNCNNMSGGELQMVLIARALIKKPQILIMDEPESHLDMRNQLKVLNIVEELNAQGEYSIIINTHFPQHAFRIAQSTLLLGKDGYVFDKTEDVVNTANLRHYFGINSEILSFELADKSYSTILPIDLQTVEEVLR